MIERVWYQKNFLSYLLLPLSFLYRAIILIRKYLYRFKIVPSYSVGVPVIVVGNITVGGTGKTPLVIAIANQLLLQGLQPAIIIRGYRGKNKIWPARVCADSDPYLFGDEAVLMANKTDAVVIAGPNRVMSAKLAAQQFHCNMIVSDDGLQHLRLQRSVEIAVVDGERRFGNGWCLPAGPLREPIDRLKKVDVIVINGEKKLGLFENEFLLPFEIENSAELIALKEKKLIVVTAIGNPDRFFISLRKIGLQFQTRVFRDHYFFSKSDLLCDQDAIIVMTEKDAIKCRHFSQKNIVVVCGKYNNMQVEALAGKVRSALALGFRSDRFLN